MTPDYTKARRHLGRDAVLKPILKRVGPCMLTPGTRDLFAALVRCVVSQQLSTKAANTISERIATRCGGAVTAEALTAVPDDDLRACGLSGAKVRTVRNIIAHTADRPDWADTLRTATDDEVRREVTGIKGLGPWSSDMLLIFTLGRTDVWPVGDLGVRSAVRRWWGLAELPSPDEMTALAEPWRPYRSVAAWYLWRSLDT